MDVLPQVRSIIRGWNDYITEGFTEEELEMYMDMTERLAARAADYAKLSSDAYSDLEGTVNKPKKGGTE